MAVSPSHDAHFDLERLLEEVSVLGPGMWRTSRC